MQFNTPLPFALSAVLLLALTACSGAQRVGPPVMPDVLPKAAPELERPANAEQGPIVVAHEDGHLYMVDLPADAEVGQLFVVKHGGKWSSDLGPRPIVGALRVARRFEGGVALAQVEYALPDVKLQGAILELWEAEEAPNVAKGLATIEDVDGEAVRINRGFFDGVQVGDRYFALNPEASEGDHLGDRLNGVILITRLEEEAATGEVLLQGGVRGVVEDGQWALFAGPGVAEPPLEATIEVGKIVGGDLPTRDAVAKALGAYLERYPAWRVKATAVDIEADPLDPAFGRLLSGQKYLHSPRMLLGGKIVRKSGRDHLVLNYANTGLSVAHGMVAATPEMGMDVGPVDKLVPGRLESAFHALLAATLTHRGQNAEALYFLETVLRDGGWDVPTRWHARDQLAMRWVQSSQVREALRLVLQDIARGQQTDDPYAVINAVGTEYALYEELGLDDKSVASARDFYEKRKALGDGVYTNHAYRAWLETLFKTGRFEDAHAGVADMESLCGESIKAAEAARRKNERPSTADQACVMDLYHLYMGGYWYVGDKPEVQRQFRERALELAYLLEPTNVASIRIVQALEGVRSGDLDGATIAFLEARRLFEKADYEPGLARVDSLRVNLLLAQNDRQQAFDSAMDGADSYARVHDLSELASVYRSVARLYLNVPPHDMSLSSYVRAAAPVLAEALKLQLSTGDLGSAAEIFYISGRFRLGANLAEAERLLTRASAFALRVVRFDVAALASLTQAMVARAKGSQVEFHNHLGRARRFAELSGDAELLQTIIQAEQGGEPERPTL